VVLGQERLTRIVVQVAQRHHAEVWGAHALRELGQWSAPVIGLMSAKDGALTLDQDRERTIMLVKALAASPKRRWRYPMAVVSGRVA